MTSATEKPTRRPHRRATDQDRAIVARREAGATRQAIADQFGLSVSQVHNAECLARWDATGREMLAADPESLEGFCRIGELDSRAYNAVHGLNYPRSGNFVMERVGDVASAGRAFFEERRFTPRTMAILDAFLEQRGFKWSSNPRLIKRPEPPKPVPQDERSDIVSRIMHHLGWIKGEMNTLREQIDVLKYGASHSSDDADEGAELERDGNLICLPGVSLSSVRQTTPDQPEGGPSAA